MGFLVGFGERKQPLGLTSQELPFLPFRDRCSACSRTVTSQRIKKIPSPRIRTINNCYLQVPATSLNLRFCLYFGYSPVPCRAIHLQYVVFLAKTLSTSSIPNYFNVVRLLHMQCGYPTPLEDPLFKHQKSLLMRGIKRINGYPMSQKLPVTLEALYKLE